MEPHRGPAHGSTDADRVRGRVRRGSLLSSWFCHPLVRPGALLGPSAGMQAAFGHSRERVASPDLSPGLPPSPALGALTTGRGAAAGPGPAGAPAGTASSTSRRRPSTNPCSRRSVAAGPGPARVPGTRGRRGPRPCTPHTPTTRITALTWRTVTATTAGRSPWTPETQ